MAPTTYLCAVSASTVLPIANSRGALVAATRKRPTSGFMRAVVAAYSSSSRGCTGICPPQVCRQTTPPARMVTRRTLPPATLPLCAVRLATTSASDSSSNKSASQSLASARQTSSSSLPSSSTTTVTNTDANPPHTTRPPPLELPERNPDASRFSHLFATGKAYVSFYKTGLRYLVANTKEVRVIDAKEDDKSNGSNTRHATRSDLLLRRRWSHDMRRLPLFGLLLLICGEFTPFVVLLFPHVVPYTCRIPKQVQQLRTKVEERRQAAFKEYEMAASTAEKARGPESLPAADTLLITRSLGLVAPFWDRIGLLSAAPSLARRSVERRVAYLFEDDALLRQAGGAAALEPEELLLASADRGLNVVGQNEGALRRKLAAWLELTRPQTHNAGAEDDHTHSHQQMLTLLTQRPEAWPQK
ncbi:hypothetical protein SEPCBS119000_001916 [Sporothrix epigloea]|uniref:Letm1 RBD domain-containing protein n=1 Tax=Sporothrix epigloea TaxID=1892477 RepID=A0ABP0DEX3_9PEZI